MQQWNIVTPMYGADPCVGATMYLLVHFIPIVH